MFCDNRFLFAENWKNGDAENSGDFNKEKVNASGEVFYSENEEEDESSSGCNENLQKRICALEQENQML